MAIVESLYVHAVEDSEAAHLRIKFLEAQSMVKLEKDEGLHKEVLEKNNLVSSLKLDISNIKIANEKYESVIENQKEEINYLENATKKASKISENHHRTLVAEKPKFRAEVKVCRNELGEEKIKLEEELFEAKKILNKTSSVLASPPDVIKHLL